MKGKAGWKCSYEGLVIIHKAWVQYKETPKQDTMAHTCILSIVEMKYKDHKIQGHEITFQKKQSKQEPVLPPLPQKKKKEGAERKVMLRSCCFSSY